MGEKLFNTPEGALKVFSIYFREMEKKEFDLSGKTILNIGAGDLIGLDALFLLFGARRVISLDLNRGNYLYPEVTAQWPFFEELAEHVRGARLGPYAEPWTGIIEKKNGKAFYNPCRLHRVTPCDAAYIPIRGACVDFAFSNAVLEHVQDPERVIQEISRVLKPGGQTMHRVDLRDHADFSRPLEFLKPGVSPNGCNLWRAQRFRERFGRPPLRILDFIIFDSCKVTKEERRSFVRPFSSLPCSELEKLRFMIYARKIKNTKRASS